MPVPLVSVIVPVYNGERTIERCVQSVLGQTLSDFELIVVDDASTDSTLARLARFNDPRLSVLVQRENRGVSAARNRGIAAARADLICFLDSDDEYLPHKLQAVHEYFFTHGDVDVLVDSFETHYPSERGRPPRKRLNPDLHDSAAVRRATYCRELYKATPALNVRRRALAAAGLFDEGMRRREDMELLIRLSHVARCESTSRVLWKKHWQGDSLSWPVDTFMTSLVDVAIRHSEYLTDAQYRRGLARDVARHFARLLWMGRLRVAAADFRSLSRCFGAATGLRLLLEGALQASRGRPARV